MAKDLEAIQREQSAKQLTLHSYKDQEHASNRRSSPSPSSSSSASSGSGSASSSSASEGEEAGVEGSGGELRGSVLRHNQKISNTIRPKVLI